MVEKIISGGQTGADQGGLEAAKILGIPTGGTAPFGWKTEKGGMPVLLRDTYNLVANLSPNYPDRTRANVLNSDGTVIFGNISASTKGSSLTLSLCRELKKPVLTLTSLTPDTEIEKFLLLEWISRYNIRVLNVAGNRESKNPGIQEKVKNFLVEALKNET